MYMCCAYGRGGAEKFVLPPATQISEEGAGEASTRIERRKAKFKNRPLDKLDRQSKSLEELASVLDLKSLLDTAAPDKQHPLPDTFRPWEKVKAFGSRDRPQLSRDELRATRECISRYGNKRDIKAILGLKETCISQVSGKPWPFPPSRLTICEICGKTVCAEMLQHHQQNNVSCKMRRETAAAEAKAAIQEEDELFFSMRQPLYSVGLQSPTEFREQMVQCPYCKAWVKAFAPHVNQRATPLEQHKRNNRKCLEHQKAERVFQPIAQSI